MSAYVGQQLRQARQSKNLSLEQISRATYIRVSYLEALEAGQLERLPSPAQARGFLRTYAKYLNMA
ncbi:MAG TPA: helix-turn-helix domain-containing protein, partial [Anaerolineales bacterium]|nr:helix-turn-helix domain-containing protein [Anaerolineales bacterium]